MHRRRDVDSDRGDTLIEIILSIAILGVCVVAVASMIAMSIQGSRIHQDQSTAQQALHNYAESLESSYTACSGGVPPTYTLAAQPSNFKPPSVQVAFWTGSSFSTTTCPASDPGLQQLTITLSDNSGTVTESLSFVLRKLT